MSVHVEKLFSAAYDKELSPEAKAAFDLHLTKCTSCSVAFAELTTTIKALHELEPAHMPRPVRLPEGSPIVERHWVSLPRLQWGKRFVAGLAAAGVTMAAGGVAAVVLSEHSSSRGVISSTLGGSFVPGAKNNSLTTTSGACSNQGCFAVAPTTICIPERLQISISLAAKIPSNYNHYTKDNDGIKEVILATPTLKVAPGSIISIYARQIDENTGTVYLPCATLAGPISHPAAPLSTLPGAQIASVGLSMAADGSYLQATIPTTAVSGESFQIIVDVPIGSGESQSHQVTLLLYIS